MSRLILSFALASLLAACSAMPGPSASSGASGTTTMGAPGAVQNGTGPRGGSGGGPN